MTDSVRVREISPGDKLKPFVDLWWKYNSADPHWVPPLRMVVNKALDRRKHPFHKHAEVAYFLAERGGETVGRIAAFVNRLHNETHGERTGFFGFFEAEDRAETARALVDAAAAWLRERGMESMRGPFNFSTNEEVSSPGILIDGFDMPPFVTMSHNPRYYGALMEAAGLAKLKDLVAYRIPSPDAPERLKRGVDAMLKRHGATIRSLDMKNFEREVGIVKDIYNSAWSLNWGFVPFTDEEFAYVANDMKSIVDPALCLIAEVKGEPVGFSLALPDINQALRHLPSGRLTPLNVLKLLWYQRKVDALRVITLGFRPGYQHQGLGAAFYLKTFLNGAERGYKTAEGSWILEDNWEMRQALDKQGAYVYKTYRIYETAL
jgi:GNAT superfamily N-acetyltransferase